MKEFDIEKFNIIQDEENYYFFRALNLADIDDLEKQIVGTEGTYNRIRTDRERWEQNPELEPPRYNSNSTVSLQEMHDHIKMHYRKDTNCISLSSNANISICYARGSYKDKYVLIKVPKKEFGNGIYNAGSYMLGEIEKKLQTAISNLEEAGEQEILSKLSEIDNARSSEEISDIVTGLYKVSREERVYRGKKLSVDRLQAISKRFKRYSSLNDNQVLEKNRLIGKLTTLEYYNKIAPIIPYTRTNSQVLGSVGNAFSSSEIIHYGDIPGDRIINIPSRLVDMLAMLQQLREKSVDSTDIEKIAKLENEIIKLAIQGYEFRETDNNVIFTNGQVEIELEKAQDIPEFSPISIEDGYNLTSGREGYTEISDFLKKYYYISKSKLRARELARDLNEIIRRNPEYEDIIRKLETSTYEVEPEIMDRTLDNNYTISEAVGIDVTEIEKTLISDLEKLSLDDLKSTVLDKEKAESQISKYFQRITETQDKNAYYAKAIVDSYDWDKIGISFTKEQEKLLIDKLSKQDLQSIYSKLKLAGIQENEVPVFLLNLSINARFKSILESDNFEKEILERSKELRKNISIEQVENYLGFYEIKGTSIVLKEYQQRAVDNLDKILENHRFASVILPTGAGKTFVEIAEMLKDKYNGQKVLCLAPSNEILWQMQDYLVEYVIGRKGSLGKTNAEIVKERFPNLDLWTYSALKSKGANVLKNSKYGLIFLDELHRIGAEDWGRNGDVLLDAQEETTKIIGITATPERDREIDPYKKQKRNMADELALKLGYTEEEVQERKTYCDKNGFNRCNKKWNCRKS